MTTDNNVPDEIREQEPFVPDMDSDSPLIPRELLQEGEETEETQEVQAEEPQGEEPAEESAEQTTPQTPEEQSVVQQLQAQLAQLQQRDQEREIERVRLQEIQNRISQGMSEEDARAEVAAYEQQFRQYQQLQATLQWEQRKYTTAIQLATRHGLDINDLEGMMQSSSETDMQSYATLLARVKRAEQTQTDTRRSQVRAGQQFESGMRQPVAGRSDDATFLSRFNSGDLPMSTENIQRVARLTGNGNLVS